MLWCGPCASSGNTRLPCLQEIQTRLRIAAAAAIFTQDVIARGDKTLPLYQRVAEAQAARAIVLPATEGQPLQVLLLSCVMVSLGAAMEVDRQREPSSCPQLRGSHGRGLLCQHVLCPRGGSCACCLLHRLLCCPPWAVRGSYCCCAGQIRRPLPGDAHHQARLILTPSCPGPDP